MKRSQVNRVGTAEKKRRLIIRLTTGPSDLFIFVIVAGFVGCATTRPERPVSLDFLEHAPVTREQVATQLGLQSASFKK